MMERVFMNLATNAIQAIEDGGKLNVTTKRTNGFVEINFKDTGMGMSNEILKKIFKPFFTTKETGTGLGLANTKRIVLNHGGKISAENSAEGGARFTIRIPVNPDSAGEDGHGNATRGGRQQDDD